MTQESSNRITQLLAACEQSHRPFGVIKEGELEFDQLVDLAVASCSRDQQTVRNDADVLWQINDKNCGFLNHTIADVTVIVCPLHMFLDFSFALVTAIQKSKPAITSQQCHLFAPEGLFAKLRGQQKVLALLKQFKIVIVADRHLRAFQNTLKQRTTQKDHPVRQTIVSGLMNSDPQATALLQTLQSEHAKQPTVKRRGDLLQFLNGKLPTKKQSIAGIIPKRTIYINSQYMEQKPFHSAFSWFLSIPQCTHYTFKKRNRQFQNYIDLVSEAPLSLSPVHSGGDPQIEMAKHSAYMFHVNSNVVCVKLDFKGVPVGVECDVARQMASLLKRVNATILPLDQLLTVMMKDFISQRITSRILEGEGRGITKPVVDMEEFQLSVVRLQREIGEPCAICFKEHYSDTLPIITNCCHKMLCYDCLAQTTNSTSVCPFCRKSAPLFPPQRYYVPLSPAPADQHSPFYKEALQQMQAYIQTGRSEGFTRILIIKLLQYMHLSRDDIRVVIQCCKESQVQLSATAIMIMQLVQLFKSEADFIWNIFFSFGVLDLIASPQMTDSSLLLHPYNAARASEYIIDVDWFRSYTIIDRTRFFTDCNAAIYISRMDGIDAWELSQCTHFISFDHDCVTAVLSTISDPINRAIAIKNASLLADGSVNRFPLKKIDELVIPESQFIPVEIISK